MKKLLIITVALMLVVSTAYAADFAPTLLKLSADPIIQYDFGGSDLSIPVKVTGTTAGIIFCVYTRDKGSEIGQVQNGFLGWHHVNKVDTCLYYSVLKSVSSGSNTITWDGKDQDGGIVPAGEYTYYLWAFDNQGSKTLVTDRFWPNYDLMLQEVDEAGLPMANPIYYEPTNRWRLGNDPLDSTLLETSSVTLTEGWARCMQTSFDPYDFNYFYMQVWNSEATSSGIQKFKWVPGGECELQTDFGDNGLSELFGTDGRAQNPGVVTNGVYLYTVWRNREQIDPGNTFFIYDYDGFIVDDADLIPWWSKSEDLAAGAQMNGGPNDLYIRNEMCFLNCHCSCLVQMVDPLRFLDTEELDDFFVWTNGNGDYVIDTNFEETAALPWVCMDYNVGPYNYSINADDNLFTIVNAYDVGAVTFGLFGPDGTGISYLAFAGETAGWKRHELILDSGTPFDGIYCDNMQAGGSHYEEYDKLKDPYTYFIGHDSITGLITSGVGVDEAAPAAFSVAQNAPNPFNPTTTISFSLAEAGAVSVAVYNVAGQKIDTIMDRFMEAGSHSVVWDASGFSAGVYFYTVKSGGFSKTIKMTLVK